MAATTEKINAWGLVAFGGQGYGDFGLYGAYLTETFDFENHTKDELFALYDSLFVPETFIVSYSADPYPQDPDLGTLRTDVFNTGIDIEVSRDFVLGVDWIHRDDGNFIIWDDPVPRNYTGVDYGGFAIDGFIGASPQTVYVCEDCSDPGYIITNRDDYYDRKTDMVMVSLERRASRNFNFSTSITWQDTRGNMSNNDGSLWGTSAADEHDNPNYNGHPFQFGAPTYMRKWNWKLLANYRLPWGILASGFANVSSGRPWRVSIGRLKMQEEIGQSVNDGRIGSFPLEARGDRTWQMLKQVDLRFQKTFEMSGASRVEMILDVFNVLNDDQPTDIETTVGSNYAFEGSSRLGRPDAPGDIVAGRQVRLGGRLVF